MPSQQCPKLCHYFNDKTYLSFFNYCKWMKYFPNRYIWIHLNTNWIDFFLGGRRGMEVLFVSQIDYLFIYISEFHSWWLNIYVYQCWITSWIPCDSYIFYCWSSQEKVVNLRKQMQCQCHLVCACKEECANTSSESVLVAKICELSILKYLMILIITGHSMPYWWNAINMLLKINVKISNMCLAGQVRKCASERYTSWNRLVFLQQKLQISNNCYVIVFKCSSIEFLAILTTTVSILS